MKLLLFATAILLSACTARPSMTLYQVRLANGESLYATHMPQREQQHYLFSDVNAQHYRLPDARVLTIESVQIKGQP